MWKRLVVVVAVLSLGLLSVQKSHAWRIWRSWKDLVESLQPVRPGPEIAALKPLLGSFRLTGSMPAGVLAKDSPELKSQGTHMCKAIMNDTFLECDIADTARSGDTALHWAGKVLMGWDHQDKAYRAAIVDSQGTLGMLEGKMDGETLVMELVSKNTLFGDSFKYRLVFDMRNHEAIQFRSEVATPDGKWVPTEMKTLSHGNPKVLKGVVEKPQ